MWQSRDKSSQDKNFLISLIEDFVEDSIKFIFISAEFKAAKLIGENQIYEQLLLSYNISPIYARNIGNTLDYTTKYLSPLAIYAKINEYSDKIGDYVQNSVELLTDFSYNNATLDEI